MTVLFGPVAAPPPYTDGRALDTLVDALRAGELDPIREQIWLRPTSAGKILTAPRSWQYDVWTDDRPLHAAYAWLKALERDPRRCFSAARWRAHLAAFPDLDARSRDYLEEKIARLNRESAEPG